MAGMLCVEQGFFCQILVRQEISPTLCGNDCQRKLCKPRPESESLDHVSKGNSVRLLAQVSSQFVRVALKCLQRRRCREFEILQTSR